MLNDKGFDLWADGYDKSVGISDEGNTYPFAGYKKVLGYIFVTTHNSCQNGHIHQNTPGKPELSKVLPR